VRQDAIIVGGGAAGILLARRFREQGIRYRLLERGKIGQAWRDMPHAMTLLSPAVPGTDWTSLTLADPIWALPGAKRPFPTREDFLCYLDAYAREYAVSAEEGVSVERCAVLPGGAFRLETSAGPAECRRLVLATGACSVPVLPEGEGFRGNPKVLHSSAFLGCLAYGGKRLLVVGGGNSAAEAAIELAGTARVTLCTREGLKYFSETGGLEHIRGSSESLLKELVRFGIVGLREGDPPVAVEGGRVAFRSGQEEEYDCILCCTGYRPAWIAVEGGTVETSPATGFPLVSPTGESTVPGLFLCGSLARYHRRCAFIHGFRGYVEKVLWGVADSL
jgi:putative flavoprotein involved in K+ transport